MSEQDNAVRRYQITNSKTMARIALEVFSIVLGVLVALAVSEWQEGRQLQERTQAALGNVRTELAQNVKIL